jgi:hypothetical protein
MSDLRALPERIRQKVVVDLTSGCWLWGGYVYPNGYGYTHQRVGLGEFKAAYVHRFAYELLVGPITNQLDHLCRVRNCCNPSHLEDVTARTNVRRGTSPIAGNAKKTHCGRGHEFTPSNTRITPRGTRDCLKCCAIRQEMVRIKKGRTPGPYSEGRICVECATHFNARQPWQKYCGPDCRKAARRG